jgi:hypothetical protein
VFLTDTEVAGRLELPGDAPDHSVVIARTRFAATPSGVLTDRARNPRQALGASPWRGSSGSLCNVAELG